MVRAAAARGDRGLRRPATWARTSSAPASTWRSTVHAGAGAYICGEETALLDSLEGYRGQPRLKPPFPAVEGCTPARPWSTTSSRSPPCRPSSATARPTGSPLGTEKSTGFGIFSLSGHVHQPGPVRGAARHHAARAAGPGRRHPGRAPARSSGRRAARPPRCSPTSTWTSRWTSRTWRGRVDARHPGAADVRRDHLRGPGGAALDRVLRARVVRQVHAVPRGHVLGRRSCCEALENGQGTEEDLEKLLDICDNITGRAFCALGDGAKPDHVVDQVLPGRVPRAPARTAAARSTRPHRRCSRWSPPDDRATPPATGAVDPAGRRA